MTAFSLASSKHLILSALKLFLVITTLIFFSLLEVPSKCK